MSGIKTLFSWVKNKFKKNRRSESTPSQKLTALFKSKSGSSKLLGCKPDLPDDRDHIKLGSAIYQTTVDSVKDFSLKKYAPPVQNQKNTSACGGFAASAAVFILRNKMLNMVQPGNSDKDVTGNFLLSPLYIYYNARFVDFLFDDKFYGKVSSPLPDCGVTLRSLMKALKKYGVVPEIVMPFYKFTPDSNPPEAIDPAKNFKIKEYLRISMEADPEEICKNVLVAEHLPIIAGLYLYKEQMDNLDYYGYLEPCKDIKDAELIGGHAVCITGFKQKNGQTYFEFLNSWGTSTGDFGYGYFPASFLSDKNYVMDLWTFDKSYF